MTVGISMSPRERNTGNREIAVNRPMDEEKGRGLRKFIGWPGRRESWDRSASRRALVGARRREKAPADGTSAATEELGPRMNGRRACGHPGSAFVALVVSRSHRSYIRLTALVAILSFGLTARGERPEAVVVTTGRTIAVSFDTGRTWDRLPLPSPPGRIHKLRTTSRGTMLVAARRGLFFGSGQNWKRVLEEETFAAEEVAGRLLAGTRRGLLVSDDDGRHWKKGETVPEGVIPLAIERAPSEEQIVYLGTARHGVWRSDSGGQNWRAAHRGLPPSIGAAAVTPVVNLAVDPRDPSVVYAASEVDGIFKTVDGGQTWQAVNEGLPRRLHYPTYPPLVAISPENPDVVYAVIGEPVEGPKLENRLYKTFNGGRFWREVTGLTEGLVFRSLTIHPSHPRVLWLGHEGGVIRIVDDPAWDRFLKQPPEPIRAGELPTPTSATSSAAQLNGEIVIMVADKDLFNEFNLELKTVEFMPVMDRQGRFLGYDAVLLEGGFITEQGTRLIVDDNDSVELALPFPFVFYGTPRRSLFVNSNGNLTFDSGDPDPSPTELEFVTKQPRISPLWNDFDPRRSGLVFFTASADRFTVTWQSVPETGDLQQPPRSTFQATLFASGRIRLSYARVESVKGLVGISPGGRAAFWRVHYTSDLSKDPQQPTSFRPPTRQGDLPIGELFRAGLFFREVAQRFYRLGLPDDFDELIVYGASTFERLTISGRVDPTNNFLVPVFAHVMNDIRGIGMSQFDDTVTFGSTGRLRLIVNMDLLRSYPPDPDLKFTNPPNGRNPTKSAMDILAQMVAHAWIAYARFDDNGLPSEDLLAGTERRTWSFFFSTDASQEDGCEWGSGRTENQFVCLRANEKFSHLDQYFMGLREPEEVAEEKFFLITNPSQTQGRTKASLPELGFALRGTRRDIRVRDIIAAEGPRDPAVRVAPKQFRLAFILVVPEGIPPLQLDLNKINAFRTRFEEIFPLMTDGRGSIMTRLQ